MDLSKITAAADRGDHYGVVHADHGSFQISKDGLHPLDEAVLRELCAGGKIKGYAGEDAADDPAAQVVEASPPTDDSSKDAETLRKEIKDNLDSDNPDHKAAASKLLTLAVKEATPDASLNDITKSHQESAIRNPVHAAEDDTAPAATGLTEPTPVAAAPAEMDVVNDTPPEAPTSEPTPPAAPAAPQMGNGPPLASPIGSTLQSIANSFQGNPQAAAAITAGDQAYDSAIKQGLTTDQAQAARQTAITAANTPAVQVPDAGTQGDKSQVPPAASQVNAPGGANLGHRRLTPAVPPAEDVAAIAKSDVEQQKAIGEAKLANQIAINENDKAKQDIEVQQQAETDEKVATLQKEHDDLFQAARTPIDPNHYMKSLGPGGAFAQALFLALGTFGSAWAKIPNTTLDFLNRSIDQDIHAQEFNRTKTQELASQSNQYIKDYQSAQLLKKSRLLTVAAAKLQAQLDQQQPSLLTAQNQLEINKIKEEALKLAPTISKLDTEAKFAPIKDALDTRKTDLEIQTLKINLAPAKAIADLKVQEIKNAETAQKAAGESAPITSGSVLGPRPANDPAAQTLYHSFNKLSLLTDPGAKEAEKLKHYISIPVVSDRGTPGHPDWQVEHNPNGTILYQQALTLKPEDADTHTRVKAWTSLYNNYKELKDFGEAHPYGGWTFGQRADARALAQNLAGKLTSAGGDKMVAGQIKETKAEGAPDEGSILDALSGKNEALLGLIKKNLFNDYADIVQNTAEDR